jgi:hypothetical protein
MGEAEKAGPWLMHIEKVYPEDARHIIPWFAHRVQRPGDKINHILVLGGAPGIGKDTILESLKYAVGFGNFADASPAHILGRFNPFLKSVVLRINEAHDLGEGNRYAFYDRMKVFAASPPDVLRIDEKNIREYYVPNCCGIIMTTNHKCDGLYLPADDRRHYVAWSTLCSDDFSADYWQRIYRWFEDGGHGHVAAYLRSVNLSSFDPKAPPPKTPAFWSIADANRAPEDAEVLDVLDMCSNPDAITTDTLAEAARSNRPEFYNWLMDRRNRRTVPHRLESAGYTAVRNDAAVDRLWKIHGRRHVVYAKKSLPDHDQIAADRALRGEDGSQ